MTELRPYQQEALDKAREHVLAGKRSVLIQLATGLGKTRVAVEACALHAEQGGKPLFIAPRKELIDQARTALRARGLELAWVRSIQELSRPNAEVPPATLVVLDEARHYVADAWSELRAKLPNALYIGLDATPERGDGRGLGSMFDVIVEAISLRDATAQGWLVPAETLRPDRALGPGELAQDPVDAYLEHAAGTSAVVFAPSVELAIQYACAFRDRGVKVGAVFGDMQSAARTRWLDDYSAGRCSVLTNAYLLTEGWDSPRTECVILARGFGSAGGYLQAVGRALRPYDGKTKALIIDLRGVSHTFGDPDEPRTWHLDGKAARRAAEGADVRFCPVCGSPVVTEAGAGACELCGHAGEMRLRKPKVLGLPLQRFARKRAEGLEEKARTFARWLALARSKGWKTGHAWHRFVAVYGEKPSHEIQRAAMRFLTTR